MPTPFESKRLINKKAIDSLLGFVPKGQTGTEAIPISDAVGRVLAKTVEAVRDDPPYSRSTVEGYLLLASQTALASSRRPITLEVIGDIPDPSMSIELPLGKTVRVKNGSYMAIKRFSEGHYAVFKASDVTDMGSKISVTSRIEKHENLVLQGSVYKTGRVLFEKGYRLRSKDIFVLASQATLKVTVAKPPQVAIFSTGNELLAPTEPYRIGCTYDCNSYGLSAMVRESGGVPQFFGIMPDRLSVFTEKLAQTIKEADMVIVSGAMTVGGRSFIIDLLQGAAVIGLVNPDVIADLRQQTIVAADGIKPHILGMIEKKPVICVGGKPEQAAQGFRLFARPTITHLLGGSQKQSRFEERER